MANSLIRSARKRTSLEALPSERRFSLGLPENPRVASSTTPPPFDRPTVELSELLAVQGQDLEELYELQHLSHHQNPVITKMVHPEPCKELRRRPQLFLAGTAPY